MIPLAQAYVKFKAHPLTYREANDFAEEILAYAVPIVASRIQADAEIALAIEVGSCKTILTISCVVTALINYGGIRESVDYLVKDGRAVAKTIIRIIDSSPSAARYKPVVHAECRRMLPGKLQLLFKQVENKTLSAEAATQQSIVELSECEAPQIVAQLHLPLSLEFKGAHDGRKSTYVSEDLHVLLESQLSSRSRHSSGSRQYYNDDVPRIITGQKSLPAGPIGDGDGLLVIKALPSRERERVDRVVKSLTKRIGADR